MNIAELTIKQFLNCKRIADLEQDPLNRNIRLLAEVSGMTIDEVEALPIEVLKKRLKELSDINTLVEGSKVNMNIKVKGERFRIVWQLNKLTAAQYIEVCEWTKDSENIIYNIHKILASLAIRRTWYGKLMKRDASEHKYISDLFYNHMKIGQAYPIMLFFCKFSQALHENILTSLEVELKTLTQKLASKYKQQTQMDIGANGAGLR